MTVPARARAREARTPIAGSVTRAAALAEWCEVRHGVPVGEPGWTTARALLDEPGRFDAWRADLGDWLRGQYGEAPERTTAGYVMSWYLGVVGMVGGTLFHLTRRVPSLWPSDVAIRLADEGRPHIAGVALLAEDFACLPDDPEGHHPAATVVPDDHALAALLRTRFAAHAAEFVRSFGATVRLGRRMLWAAATDALDDAAWRAGQRCGDEAAGVADSALLLPDRMDPFTSASTLRAIDGTWSRRRQSCCFHYALPGGQVCDTCPRVAGR